MKYDMKNIKILMNPEEFNDKVQEINDDIINIMRHHEAINEYDTELYFVHPAFLKMSKVLLDYIINVNEKITTLEMASFFEEKFPDMIKSDPFVFADPDLISCDESIISWILKPSYEKIVKLNDSYQKQTSIYRYMNILDNIVDEINTLTGRSIDLIKECIQRLYLHPIEIEEYY